MDDSARRVLVTGANGQIALQLFTRLARRGVDARAVVRSRHAAAKIAELSESIRPEVDVLDYQDVGALTEAAQGCTQAVHLVGILKESATASYQDAHEGTCSALAEAAANAGLKRIVYISIFGAAPESSNACLASKGRAEAILASGSVPSTTLRVPMVVGPDDPASRALRANALRNHVVLMGSGHTLQQPLDIDDLLDAILSCLDDSSTETRAFDLGGPETLSHRELVLRAAALHGNQPDIRSIPLFLAQGLAFVLEQLSSNPPITQSMLGVLQHDDEIDTRPAQTAFGLELTPLDETLRKYIGPGALAG